MASIGPRLPLSVVTTSDKSFITSSDALLLPHLTSKRHRNSYDSRLHVKGGIQLRKTTQNLPNILPYERRLVDGLVIQAYGNALPQGQRCSKCVRGLGMFSECCVITEQYGNACGNCTRAGRPGDCDSDTRAIEVEQDEAGEDTEEEVDDETEDGGENVNGGGMEIKEPEEAYEEEEEEDQAEEEEEEGEEEGQRFLYPNPERLSDPRRPYFI